MITDPLRVGQKSVARMRLSRGFCHLSSPHTSPLFSSVGAMPAMSREVTPSRAASRPGGLRLSLSLPCNTTTGVVQ